MKIHMKMEIIRMEDKSDEFNRVKRKVAGRIRNLSQKQRNAVKNVIEQLEIDKTLSDE